MSLQLLATQLLKLHLIPCLEVSRCTLQLSPLMGRYTVHCTLLHSIFRQVMVTVVRVNLFQKCFKINRTTQQTYERCRQVILDTWIRTNKSGLQCYKNLPNFSSVCKKNLPLGLRLSFTYIFNFYL